MYFSFRLMIAWKFFFFLLILPLLFICPREVAAMNTDKSVLSKKPILDEELTLKVKTATFALG